MNKYIDLVSKIGDFSRLARNFLGITDNDVELLHQMKDRVSPTFEAVITQAATSLLNDPQGQECIKQSGLSHERAVALFKYWLESVFTGNFDEKHALLVARISLAHVRNGVSEDLMIETMGAFNRELLKLCSTPQESIAVTKALYWNLSIMISAYEYIRGLVKVKALGVERNLEERLVRLYAKEVYTEIAKHIY
ncbi:MAG: protoglobin domain-containing protein [Infirmifilum uzonense]|uniref:protoglobin domain-containing protein n=1 Tax=Infirmifilum uzonense TaxID=1550241 RepID=UPI003C711460